jgi:hypothetical protein
VGSIETRLNRLEDLSQERAVVELRHAWSLLTDQEIASVLKCLGLPGENNSGVSQPERQAVEKARAYIPEELIARAIGLTEGLDSEEIHRRIKALTQRLGIFERGPGIRRHLRVIRERRR